MVPARPGAIRGISFLATMVVGVVTLPASDGTYTPGEPVHADFQDLAQGFLDKHCLECHDDETTKADFAALNVYTSAIGGMAELYAVIDGTSTQAATAKTYFDGLMSVYFSPKMFENVINYMLDYLAGNWDYKVGDGKYEPVWIVDAGNVANYEGFTGH